ncbi:MAG: transposase [Fibrobacteres bacterium]|nr:transposase [Fibrobacterota bacterium]
MKQGQPLFGTVVDGKMMMNEYGRHVASAWRDLPQSYPEVALDEFVVMPNHFHGIVWIEQPGSDAAIPVVDAIANVGAIHESPLQQREPNRLSRRGMTVSRLVGRFKMTTAKWINERQGTPAAAVWQRNYHDRIIRDSTELARIRALHLSHPGDY